MATEWVMVRVTKTTHAALTALRDRIEKAHVEGKRLKDLPRGERDVFSLDGMIAELVSMKLSHLKRSRKPRRRRDAYGPYLG